MLRPRDFIFSRVDTKWQDCGNKYLEIHRIRNLEVMAAEIWDKTLQDSRT